MKGAVKVLRNEMRLMPATDIGREASNTKPDDAITGIITHPLNANIARYGCHAAEKSIKSSES